MELVNFCYFCTLHQLTDNKINMLASTTSHILPQLPNSNPEDRTASDPAYSNAKNNIPSNLTRQIDTLLDNHQLEQAKRLAIQHPHIKPLLHHQLFKRALKQVISSSQTQELNYSTQYSEDLNTDEREILNHVQSIRRRKSFNLLLTNFLSRRLQDFIRGKSQPIAVLQEQQHFLGHPVIRSIIKSLGVIDQMIRSDRNNSKVEIQRYFGQQIKEIQKLRVRVESLERENQALLRKESISVLKVKEAHAQYITELANQIKIKKQLHSLQDHHQTQIEDLNSQFSKQIEQIRNLFKKSTDSSLVYAHIGATITDMKQLILKLSNQNKILNEERQALSDKLNFIEVSLLKKPSSPQDTTMQQQLISLRLAATRQEQKIENLQSKIKQMQHSRLNDSMNVSSTSLGLEDSRTKSVKIARTNPRDLAKEVKKKDEEIHNLQAKLKEHQNIIVELQDKLKESITFDLSDSLTLSESTTSLLNINSSSTNNIRISKTFLQKLDETNRRKEEEIENLKAAIEQYKLEIDILKGQQNEDALADFQVKMALLQQDCSEKERRVTELQMQTNSLKEKSKAQCRQLRDKIMSLERRLKTKEQQLITEKEGNRALNYLIEDLKQLHKEQLHSEQTQNQALKKEVANLKAFIKALEENSKKSQADLEQAILEMKEKEEQLLDQLKKSEQQLKSPRETEATDNLKSELKIKTEQYNQLLVEYDLIANNKNELAEKLFSLEKILEYTKAKQKQSDSKCAQAEKKLRTIISDYEFRKNFPEYEVNHLFNGEILEDAPDSKVYLKQQIQNRYNLTIFRTKLLYKDDPFNKVNFHKYIDNKQNLLVIVELSNGLLVAGYYHGKIYPKMVADKDTLLISISNRDVYDLLQSNKRGITYDQYFFILGNSELRLKISDKKFFSNFGTNNSYFRNRGNRLIAFTGSNDREVDFNSVEFYEIRYI